MNAAHAFAIDHVLTVAESKQIGSRVVVHKAYLPVLIVMRGPVYSTMCGPFLMGAVV